MKEKTMKCFACDGVNLKRASRDMAQTVGRLKISNQFGHVTECTDCGEWTITAEDLERIELQAVLVAFDDSTNEEIKAAELKDARKVLGLTQKQLSEFFGCAPETVCRWETEAEKVPAWARPAIFGMAQNRLQPLPAGLWLEKVG